MGMNVSCPFTTDDIESSLESYLVRSISFGDYGERHTYRSASFNGRDSKRMFPKSFSFKGRDLKEDKAMLRPKVSNDADDDDDNNNNGGGDKIGSPSRAWRKAANRLIAEKNLSHKDKNSKRFIAAVRLQKTYKSFRTRRRLADCAVLVEQKWWKLLDFAELKRTSVSFFDIEKHETAVSRWSRARTRAAKVGKGLSKDEKARKLALQHWLEAIDPRHRYGHNLQFYYVNWLQCESKQPFFYWLDVGEGKEVNLEKCPRSKLQHQCIKYLGPMERKKFEVIIEGGRLKYKEDGKILHTKDGPEDTKWIFVLSVSKTLYVGQKKKGTFQHSSFLAGGATLSAGRLVVEDGILQAVWPHSGHYLPTEENFEEFVLFLKQHDVDLSHVQKSPTDEDQAGGNKDSSQNIDSEHSRLLAARRASRFRPRIKSIKIPERENMLEVFSQVEQQRRQEQRQQLRVGETPEYETADEDLSDTDSEYDEDLSDTDSEYDEDNLSKHNLFDEDEDEEYEEPFLQETILKRINSHKLTRSYQLAQQLSFRWTTGAGPRIGCVRDYPSELQFRALEEVHLSPRSMRYSSPRFARYSPRVGNPSSSRETSIGKSPLALDTFKL